MAIIVPTLGTIKGSIGGLTFQDNPSGNVIRSRPFRKPSSSTKQNDAHNKHQFFLYEWQQLSQVQRDDWNTYAGLYPKTDRFGIARDLTGLNWFESVNSASFIANVVTFTSPPPHDLPAAVPTFEIFITDTAIWRDVIDVWDFTLNRIQTWCAPPTLRNTTSINRLVKRLGFVKSGDYHHSNVTAAWQLATGLTYEPQESFPSANIFIGLQTVRVSSGISSAISWMKINTAEVSEEEETLNYYI